LNKSKNTPEQNEGQREFFRIIEKYKPRLAPFNTGKSLQPGSQEEYDYNEIMAHLNAEVQEWGKKYLSLPELIDTPQKLDKWIEQALDRLEGAKGLMKGATGADDISDIALEYYIKAVVYAEELLRNNPALPELPPIKYDKFVSMFGLIELQHWCIKGQKPTQTSGGKADLPAKKPEETEQGDEWIKVSEAAEILSVNTGTVTRWANKGRIKDNEKKGRKRRVLKSSVLFLKQSREDSEVLKDAKELRKDTRTIPDQH